MKNDNNQNSNISFFGSSDIFVAKINDLLLYLHLQNIEANIILQTIVNLKNKNLTCFDSLVGDRKCQIRTLMILSSIHDSTFLKASLLYEKSIENIIFKIKTLLTSINSLTYKETKALMEQLKTISMHDFYKKEEIDLNPSHNLRLISLCYIAALKKNDIASFSNDIISISKMKRLMHHSIKPLLCKLSINYEREIAQQYNLQEVSTCLQQLETKGFCTMTAFFPSFKPIFEKMKDLQQPFVKKNNAFLHLWRS